MVNDTQLKNVNKIPNVDHVYIDGKTIFFNEIKRVCNDFGFEDVEFVIEYDQGCPDNVYKLKYSPDIDVNKLHDNFHNIIDYMLDFSKQYGLLDIMKNCFFSLH